jgi:hypothetical protein
MVRHRTYPEIWLRGERLLIGATAEATLKALSWITPQAGALGAVFQLGAPKASVW